jgi:sugar lactone lactonase YvrE
MNSSKLFLKFLLVLILTLSYSFARTEIVFASKFGGEGSDDGNFSNPTGIALDNSGNIYVTDSSNNRIQKFNSNGNFLSKFGASGSGDGNFSFPYGITVDSNGNIYVVDTDNNRIQKFDSNGNFLSKFGAGGGGDGNFSFASGIALDSGGNIYVADNGNNRIQKFNSNGNFLSKFGANGNGDGNFSHPIGIALNSGGNIYVVDQDNNRIQKFDSNGTFLLKFGTSGFGDGSFSFASGIALDSRGNIYVADTGHNRIQKFDSNGTFLLKFGASGNGDGRFGNPSGIALDSSRNIYVIDKDNNRIQKFSPNEVPIALNLAISGTVEIGQSLTGTYTFSDDDSDTESGSTFKWYRADDSNGTNAVTITDANLSTYTITSSDGGKYLAFGVTPKDGKSFGDEVNSSFTSIVPPKIDLSSIVTPNKWNMVSVPNERNVSVSAIPNSPIIWTYNNTSNVWEQPTTLQAGKGYILYTSNSSGYNLISAITTNSLVTSDYNTIKNIENNNTWTLLGISKSTSGIAWSDIYNPTNTRKIDCSYTQIFYFDTNNSTWNTTLKIPYQAGIWVKQNCFSQPLG